uniref:Uncharacterized protein n=1 Tax=Pundamilia nyererei TaxID=303518 RepID=A0A3B4FZP5_9CICH
MKGSGLPLVLFSKNKCVLWPLNPPFRLHRAPSKTTGESESPNLFMPYYELLTARPAEVLQHAK